MTLTEFLLARIAEDEATANNVTRFEVRDGIPGKYVIKDRVLAECEAKRRIIGYLPPVDGPGRDWYRFGLLQMASVYADHPDFREEWRA